MSNTEVVVQEKPTALAIQNWDDLLRRAEFYAKSSLIPVALRGKPADVAVILQMGAELGLSQMQSLNSIDCIQGKPTIPPQLGLALCRGKLPDFRVEWDCSETKAVVTGHRGNESYTATWDVARAQKLGLTGKENYQKQMGTMLQWRAAGQMLRAIASDVLKGCYLEGELDPSEGHHDGAEAAQTKLERLAGLNKKPETKQVVAEVVSDASVHIAAEAAAAVMAKQGPKPEVPKTVAPIKAEIAAEPQPEIDPNGDYKLKANHPYKGKRVRDVADVDLNSLLAAAKKHADTTGTATAGAALEDCIRIGDYLRLKEPEPGLWGDGLGSHV